MLKLRFELFAAASLAIHAGVFASALVHRTPGRPPDSGASGGTQGAGSAAAIPGETFRGSGDRGPGGRERRRGREDADRARRPSGRVFPAERRGGRAERRRGQGGERAHRSPRARDDRTPRGGAGRAPAGSLWSRGQARAAGDLVASFRHTFPIAASSGPLWDARSDRVLRCRRRDVLSRRGRNAHPRHRERRGHAPAFRSAILHTTTLLKHRLFTARGAVTHLHMVVRVTGQLVNHGAFTIDAAGSFELPSGRHVSVTIVER